MTYGWDGAVWSTTVGNNITIGTNAAASGVLWPPVTPRPRHSDGGASDESSTRLEGRNEDEVRTDLTPEMERKLRSWNRHDANRGRHIKGDNYLPYTGEGLGRAIERWKEGKGSYLIEAFLEDLTTGAVTVPKGPPPPVPEQEELPAGDPRLRRMWAGIARNAIERGTTGHYDIISREMGAPSAKRLEEEGWLRQETLFRVYKIIDVDYAPKPGERNVNRAPGGAIRAAFLKYLDEHTDEQLAADVERHSASTKWVLGEGPVVEVTADEATESVAEEGNQDGERGEDRSGGQAGAPGGGADGEPERVLAGAAAA